MVTTTLAAFALAIAPAVGFTSDSVYKQDRILDFAVAERTVRILDDDTQDTVEETVTYTLNVKENYVLGYCVYDNPDTDYIDGIKIDGEYLATDWTVQDFDPNADHSVLVKTVYADDISGWLAMAKDGDLSALMSHPAVVLQAAYYILAALSIVLGGFGLFRYRKLKYKTANDVAAAVEDKAKKVEEKANDALETLENGALALVEGIVVPLVDRLSHQNDTLIKATVLARSGDEASTLALLDLMKDSGADNVSDLADSVKTRVKESMEAYKKAKAEAIKKMQEAVADVVTPEAKPKGYDGTSI